MIANRPIWQHPAAIAIAALALLVLVSMSVSVVPETRQGLVLRYGQIVRDINPWRSGQAYGANGAGISLRVPFVEQIRLFDKRILGVTLDNQPVMSTDQVRLEVDAYARYRIVDVRRVYQTLGTEQRLGEQLNLLLATALRNELGKRTFASLLSPERNTVMSAISRSLQQEAQSFGVRIVDVRINRAELPEGAPRDSVFDRMRSARAQEAATIIAEGNREAQEIRANADAEAASIYAASFGKDPEFYAFYRAMQSYRATFRSEGAGQSTFVLPPGEGYLSEFTPRQR
jgi:membrane protease subunit HflC